MDYIADLAMPVATACWVFLCAGMILAPTSEASPDPDPTPACPVTEVIPSAAPADKPAVLEWRDVPTPEAETLFYPLTEQGRDLVERVVMAESGNQDYDGQRLVAQCILNTACARDMRPDAVVLEPGQYAEPWPQASQSVKDAVAAVFDRGELVTDEPIRWFYAPRYSAGRWHESRLTFVLEHGGHRFFKL